MESFKVIKSGKLSRIIPEIYNDISFSRLMKLLRNKDVKVNGKRVKDDIKVEVGDVVEVYYTATDIESYKVIYNDENILVVDKKVGFTAEQVFENVKRAFDTVCFIHRLDRNTSGVMIFALNEGSEKILKDAFKKRLFIKEYLTQVSGIMSKKSNILTDYLVKDSQNSIVKIYKDRVNGSVLIKTGYEVVSENKVQNTSVLKVTLYTGKTHQIRAHLAFIGHPIIGDGKYGDYAVNKINNAKYQRLIAKNITLKFDKNSTLYYLNDKRFTSQGDFGE